MGISVGLLLVTVIDTDSPLSPGPAEIPDRGTISVPVFSSTFWGGIAVIVGGWFTGVTVTVNNCLKIFTPPLAVPPEFITVTVITAVPLALATGW